MLVERWVHARITQPSQMYTLSWFKIPDWSVVGPNAPNAEGTTHWVVYRTMSLGIRPGLRLEWSNVRVFHWLAFSTNLTSAGHLLFRLRNYDRHPGIYTLLT